MDTNLSYVSQIAAAYLANNTLETTAVPGLLNQIISSLKKCTTDTEVVESVAPQPAVGVNPKKTVFPDYIVCLDDGRKYRTLKRHLGMLGMTPDEYRNKWGLPATYPMVAPNYSKKRSQIAIQIKLGTSTSTRAAEAAPAKAASPTLRKPARKAARTTKAKVPARRSRKQPAAA